MTDPNHVKISDLDIDELVSGIQVRAHRQPADWERWLIAESIHPGTTRVMSGALWEMYRQWWVDTPGMTEKLLDPRALGKRLSSRFKAGRCAKGQFYYISRTANADVV